MQNLSRPLALPSTVALEISIVIDPEGAEKMSHRDEVQGCF